MNIKNRILSVMVSISLVLAGLVTTAPATSAYSVGSCTSGYSGNSAVASCPNVDYSSGTRRWVDSFYALAGCVNYITRAKTWVYGPTRYGSGTSTATCPWYTGVSNSYNMMTYY